MKEPMEPTKRSSEVRGESFYGRLVRLYPRGFRESYGEEMVRLFRDQSRGMRANGCVSGTRFWIGIVMDLVGSLVVEHWNAMKNKSPMAGLRAAFSLEQLTFFRVFLAVYLVGVLLAVAGGWMTPRRFVSTSRLLARPATNARFDPYVVQTEFERLQSEPVLQRVITELGLAQRWGEEARLSGPMPMEAAVEKLRSKLELTQFRQTSLLGIRVTDADPKESARVANAIAEAAIGMANGNQSGRLTLIDPAEPSFRATTPNWPMILVLGSVGGAVLALIAAAWVNYLRLMREHRTVS